MPDLPARSRPSLWLRALSALGVVTIEEKPEAATLDMGSDYASGVPQGPGYSANTAMSAFPANAWLAACVDAVASDLAGLPLRARQRSADGTVTQLDGHPALDLIQSPGGHQVGVLLRRQLAADHMLSGVGYLLPVYGVETAPPAGLRRLHPARVQVTTGRDGSPTAIVYDDLSTGVCYAPESVIWASNVSWERDASSLFGQGVVRPLDADLRADTALAESSARQASKGRPDAVYRPADASVKWNDRQVAGMKHAVAKMLSDADGGVAIMSGAGVLETLGWTMKDMQGVEQRTWTRQTILAVCGVPPARVGLETANYATAREQMLTYWLSLKGRASLLDAALSKLAGMFGDADVELYHDFSQVPALKDARRSGYERVQMLVSIGMDPNDALAYEGFTDAPNIQPLILDAPAPPVTESVGMVLDDARLALRVLSSERMTDDDHLAAHEAVQAVVDRLATA